MRNIITSIALLVFIGCGEAEANSESKIVNKVIKSEDKVKTHPHTYADYKTYVNTKAHSNGIVELYLDDMTFDEAFSIEYRAKGEGHAFWWRGDQYTTDLAEGLDEFVVAHSKYYGPRLGWVLNNDDEDDNCRSNKLDDCGVCDGPGKMKWFQDKDKDGLGAFSTWITSCTYPTDVEIEKFHEDAQGITSK